MGQLDLLVSVVGEDGAGAPGGPQSLDSILKGVAGQVGGLL
jgi:hypothetical protein